MPFIVMIIAAVITFAGYAAYDEATAEHFALRKDQWSCTLTHTNTWTTYIQVGDVQVPQLHEETICDQWSRR